MVDMSHVIRFKMAYISLLLRFKMAEMSLIIRFKKADMSRVISKMAWVATNQGISKGWLRLSWLAQNLLHVCRFNWRSCSWSDQSPGRGCSTKSLWRGFSRCSSTAGDTWPFSTSSPPNLTINGNRHQKITEI